MTCVTTAHSLQYIELFLLSWVVTVPGLSTFSLFCTFWFAHSSVEIMQFKHNVALCFFEIKEAIVCCSVLL